MEASTTISGMMRGNRIIVPDYQRAYSWDTGKNNKTKNQIDIFLIDLEDYLRSKVKTPYYFGHFLYEKVEENVYAIIDGQQRLTTISIFLCALFNKLKSIRQLEDSEEDLYEDLIKRRGIYKFTTVQYDKQLFQDYIVDGVKKDKYGIETTSGQRFTEAYDYFVRKLSSMNESHIVDLLEAITKSSCTTHIVNSEAEAIQMFIFQNDRGKKPSHLEVIKAQFMYNIHIYGGEETATLIDGIKNRFEHIYRSISSIEDFVDEDMVLNHTLKVYSNSLWESNATEYVNAELNKDSRIEFIKNFSVSLERSFNNLMRLNSDKKKDINIEGALICGRYEIVLPFFIKAYTIGLDLKGISIMAKSLGDLILRDKVISTRADLRSRLDDIFKSFDNSIKDIVTRIEWMKKTDNWWWAYWNNDNLQLALNGNWSSSYHYIAKIILWKYENFLISEGKAGYAPISYDSIYKPHLEHIAPQTENGEKAAAGYDIYDEEFRERYLLSLGNFLLLSAPHNESIGNKPFALKRESYNQLKHQREIQIMTEEDRIWTRDKIEIRKNKIIKFILEQL